MQTLLLLAVAIALPELHHAPVRHVDASASAIFEAIGNADAAKVKQLLDADPNLVATKNAEGLTPLHAAAARTNIEIIKLLLAAKADVNATGNDGQTPLYMAAISSSKEVVTLLVDRGADVHAVTKLDRFTPLHRASQHGNVAIMKLLLDKGADVDGGWNSKEVSPSITPLHFAIREGQVDAARLLLAKGAAINASGVGTGRTPLYEAVDRRDPELVKLLLRKGADPNQSGVLASALRSGQMDVIQLFVDREADFKTDPNLLLCAAMSGKKELVVLVLAKGFTITEADNRGISALIHASRAGMPGIVRLLLEKGVNPNFAEKAYTTPLHVAATKEIAMLLLKHKANVDEVDKQGTTPMLAAVLHGNKEVAEFLESEGATHTVETMAALGRDLQLKELLKKEPLAKPKKQARPTPLQLAASFGQLQTVRVLVDAGADVNAPGAMGETPLHTAASHGHLRVVEYLVEHKADVNARMKELAYSIRTPARITPLMTALADGHADVVRFLAKAGGLPAIDDKENANSLLLDAAERRHFGIVKLLLEQGATADIKIPPVGRTVLELAAEEGDLEMVKWLLSPKFDGKGLDQYVQQALVLAVGAGRIDVVKFLLRNGGKIDGQLLFTAAGAGHVELVKLLLDKGANIDAVATQFSEHTALGHAAEQGKLEVVKLLLERGASIKKDIGVLCGPAFHGHRDVVAYLLEKGADVDEVRSDGFQLYYWTFQPRQFSILAFFAEKDATKFGQGQHSQVTIEEINGEKPFIVVGGRALQAAVAGKQQAIAALLLAKGASSKVLFPDGSTLLHMAVMQDDLAMVELLLKYSTPANTRNQKGQTALSIAISRELDDVAALLRKHGVRQ
jgi:ankyrin repeat protein